MSARMREIRERAEADALPTEERRAALHERWRTETGEPAPGAGRMSSDAACADYLSFIRHVQQERGRLAQKDRAWLLARVEVFEAALRAATVAAEKLLGVPEDGLRQTDIDDLMVPLGRALSAGETDGGGP